MSSPGPHWLQQQELQSRIVNGLSRSVAPGGWELKRLLLEGLRKRVEFSHPRTEAVGSLWFMPTGSGEKAFRQGDGFLFGYSELTAGEDGQWLLRRVFGILQEMARRDWLRPFFDASTVAGSFTQGLLLERDENFELRLTAACNERCVYCCIDPEAISNLARDREHAIELLKKAQELGARKLAVTGGEPTLVPWVAELLEQAVAMGYGHLVLQTNATRLAQGDLPARLAALPGFSLFVSLPAHNPEVLASITQRPDLFQDKVRGVEAALSAGVKTVVNHVVCRQNLSHVEDFVRWLHERFPQGLQELVFSYAIPNGSAWEAGDKTIASYSEAAPQILKGLSLAQELGIVTHMANVCGVPTCIEPGLRSFPEPGIDRVTPQMSSDRVKFENCGSCEWDEQCPGVARRYLELHGLREFESLNLTKDSPERTDR